jgi:hypothetical protein
MNSYRCRRVTQPLHYMEVSGQLQVQAALPPDSRLRLKCDGTSAATRFRLSMKRTSPFKSVGASVLSTTGSGGVRISGSNAGYTKFRGSVKGTGYPLHWSVSPSLPLPASPCAVTFQLDSKSGKHLIQGWVSHKATLEVLENKKTYFP